HRPRVPRLPRKEHARRLAAVPRAEPARCRAPGPAEIRRGRALAPGRLRGPETAQAQASAGEPVPPYRGSGTAPRAPRGDRQTGRGGEVAEGARGGEAGDGGAQISTPKGFNLAHQGRAAHPGNGANAREPYPEGVRFTGTRPRDPTPFGVETRACVT